MISSRASSNYHVAIHQETRITYWNENKVVPQDTDGQGRPGQFVYIVCAIIEKFNMLIYANKNPFSSYWAEGILYCDPWNAGSFLRPCIVTTYMYGHHHANNALDVE